MIFDGSDFHLYKIKAIIHNRLYLLAEMWIIALLLFYFCSALKATADFSCIISEFVYYTDRILKNLQRVKGVDFFVYCNIGEGLLLGCES